MARGLSILQGVNRVGSPFKNYKKKAEIHAEIVKYILILFEYIPLNLKSHFSGVLDN
jgi:hypothetical protein